jgi:hypothetical protein
MCGLAAVTRVTAGDAEMMNNLDGGHSVRSSRLQGRTSMWKAVWAEARELMWLASVVGGLSVVGVGLAVVVAAA